ncbi:MAG TPA: EscU/YscU/HrcU family type III secretion system export apparatus switch protein [Planctomycetota bacterium]|nr:EscU/YscU/HrcU family type III secretion system export apparatus switch protein [Planctomycetota bacterium]
MATREDSSAPGGFRAGLERAVALRYTPDAGRAPVVVASGRGMIARRLVEIAAEHGVPVREDPDLAALLSLVDLGHEIPAELYLAVAEVISFVHRANREL